MNPFYMIVVIFATIKPMQVSAIKPMQVSEKQNFVLICEYEVNLKNIFHT